MWFSILKANPNRKKIDVEVVKIATKEILIKYNPSVFTTKSIINLVYPRYNELAYAKRGGFRGKPRPLRIRSPMIKVLVELGYNPPQKNSWDTDDLTGKYKNDRFWTKEEYK